MLNWVDKINELFINLHTVQIFECDIINYSSIQLCHSHHMPHLLSSI